MIVLDSAHHSHDILLSFFILLRLHLSYLLKTLIFEAFGLWSRFGLWSLGGLWSLLGFRGFGGLWCLGGGVSGRWCLGGGVSGRWCLGGLWCLGGGVSGLWYITSFNERKIFPRIGFGSVNTEPIGQHRAIYLHTSIHICTTTSTVSGVPGSA